MASLFLNSWNAHSIWLQPRGLCRSSKGTRYCLLASNSAPFIKHIPFWIPLPKTEVSVQTGCSNQNLLNSLCRLQRQPIDMQGTLAISFNSVRLCFLNALQALESIHLIDRLQHRKLNCFHPPLLKSQIASVCKTRSVQFISVLPVWRSILTHSLSRRLVKSLNA